MIGLDTNILVRFLVGDDIKQGKQVYQLFKQAENEKEEFFVSELVLLELIWVLESVYKIKREDILESIHKLNFMPILIFEKISNINKFLIEAKKSNIDLSDLFIGISSNSNGCDKVLTFDKKASKHSLFKLV